MVGAISALKSGVPAIAGRFALFSIATSTTMIAMQVLNGREINFNRDTWRIGLAWFIAGPILAPISAL